MARTSPSTCTRSSSSWANPNPDPNPNPNPNPNANPNANPNPNQGIELGIGDSIMIKAVAETCGRSVAAIKESLEQEGDLGMVALQSRGKQMMMMKPKPLSVRGVFKVLTEIAMASGKDVQTRKKDKVKQMLVSAQEKEAQY